jgi:hypothetical protein
MTTARADATSTLLPNGNVLIAGGENNFAGISSTQLYNPLTNTFAASPSMTAARFFATATLLPNGMVLIAGGDGGDGVALKSVDLYNSLGNTFAASTPSMIAARYGATATLLPNGKVLIAGGSFLSTTELYNPISNMFAAGPSMSAGRSLATATLLPNGKVLIAGGAFNSNLSGALASADLYDPVANAFIAGPQMNQARFTATATLLPNGKVLISGGSQDGNVGLSSTELYDPVTNTFAASTSTPTMNQKRFSATATLLPDGKVLIAGGVSFDVGAFSSTELYDPVANTFAAMTPVMNAARFLATQNLLPNGKVLIEGGFSSLTASLNSTELYSP